MLPSIRPLQLNIAITFLSWSQEFWILAQRQSICIGNSMICSDIWHKYHEWYFEIVLLKIKRILKYHEWYFCQISRTNHAIITRKRYVIFTCRYFKLSWNTIALSQSNCKNFSCSSIKSLTVIKDRLISLPSIRFHRENNIFGELPCSPVFDHNNNNVIIHKFWQAINISSSCSCKVVWHSIPKI